MIDIKTKIIFITFIKFTDFKSKNIRYQNGVEQTKRPVKKYI